MTFCPPSNCYLSRKVLNQNPSSESKLCPESILAKVPLLWRQCHIYVCIRIDVKVLEPRVTSCLCIQKSLVLILHTEQSRVPLGTEKLVSHNIFLQVIN